MEVLVNEFIFKWCLVYLNYVSRWLIFKNDSQADYYKSSKLMLFDFNERVV